MNETDAASDRHRLPSTAYGLAFYRWRLLKTVLRSASYDPKVAMCYMHNPPIPLLLLGFNVSITR